MQSLHDRDAPDQLTSAAVAQQLIGLRILVPPNATVLFLTPPQNRVGTFTLCRLLTLALEAAGVRVTEATSSLTLNQGYFEFVVSKRADALETIKCELKGLALLPYAEIAWWDEREQIWRAAHSMSGCFHAPSGDELHAEHQFLGRILAAAQQAPVLWEDLI